MGECFNIKPLPNKGYGVVATRDLNPGSQIICEEAAVLGPASPESCLECLEITKSFCQFCGFSLCQKCQENREFLSRHTADECQLLQNIKKPNQQDVWNISGLFNIVFPLRFLRLKTTNPKLYKQLTELEGHQDQRKEQVS